MQEEETDCWNDWRLSWPFLCMSCPPTKNTWDLEQFMKQTCYLSVRSSSWSCSNLLLGGFFPLKNAVCILDSV